MVVGAEQCEGVRPAGAAQGIETVRRDNCQLVRTVVATCMEKILVGEDELGAQAYVRNTISDLLMNRLDLSLLVITKARTLLGA
jgi:DNA polymerase delta subunit 1